MALGKSVAGSYGPSVTYWRLVSVRHDADALTTTIKLNGYPDQAASDARAVPMASVDLTKAMTLAQMDNVTFAQMYTYAKTQGFFSGATDV